jgi:hypothetical protein
VRHRALRRGRGSLAVGVSLGRAIAHLRNLLRRKQEAILVASKLIPLANGGVQLVVERGLCLAIRAGRQMCAYFLSLGSVQEAMGEQWQAW